MAQVVNLRDQVDELKEAIGQSDDYQIAGLPPLQGRLLGLLMKRERASREQAFVALYHDRVEADRPQTDKDLSVHLCHLRKRLTPYGIKITTHTNAGWSLDAENKSRVQALMSAIKAGEKTLKQLQIKPSERANTFRAAIPPPSEPFVFKIDKDIPMPQPGGPNIKYRYSDMQIGDSFFVAGASRQTMVSSTQHWRRSHRDYQFVIAEITENGKIGVRVWRRK